MTDQDLSIALRALTVPMLSVDPADIEAVGRRRRRHRRAAAGAAALSVTAVVILLSGGPGSRHQVLNAAAPGLDQASVDERAVDGLPALACGGLAPLSALAARPGAETANTPEARGLRQVIDDPTGGQSPQRPHDWVLLQRQGDRVTFGQRQGPVGVGTTVTLQRNGDRYVFSGSSGCGPVGYADGRSGMYLGTWTDRGDHLVIDYIGGSCDPGPPSVHVHERASSVDVLVLTPKPQRPATACSGVGTFEHVDVALREPLGGRVVRNIAYLPAKTLNSTEPDAGQRQPDPQGQAQRRAAALVAQVVVPSGAAEVDRVPSGLARPALEIGTSHKQDAHRIWTVTASLDDVRSFFASRKEVGSTMTGTGSTGSPRGRQRSYFYRYGDLQVQAVGLANGQVGIRADAVVLWVPTRQAGERVPLGATSVAVLAYRNTPDHVLARAIVTGAAARHLTELANALPRADDTRVGGCTADFGIRQRLTFITPTGTAVMTGFFCGSVDFTLGGKNYPPLAPSEPLLTEVKRLLGPHSKGP